MLQNLSIMFPFVNPTDYHDFGMEKEISQESSKRHGVNTHHGKKDHEIVMLPVSPRHSAANSVIHQLAKSRLAWLIAILCMVVLILLYQAYFEHLKQQRLISYLERVGLDYLLIFLGRKNHIGSFFWQVEDLKISMERLQHSIQAGNDKLEQLQQIYRNATNLPLRDI